MEASATSQAQQAAGQAQEKAQEAAGQAKERAREQLDQRSTQAGEQVSTSAADLRSVAEHLRSEGKDQPAKMAEQAADRAERLGGYLKDADPDRLLHDLEDFGRRQPMAVMFGGLALGFAASRLLKASSQNRASGGTGTSTGNGADPTRQLPATTPGNGAPIRGMERPTAAPRTTTGGPSTSGGGL